MKNLLLFVTLLVILFIKLPIINSQDEELAFDQACTPEGLKLMADYYTEVAEQLSTVDEGTETFTVPLLMFFNNFINDMIISSCADSIYIFEEPQWNSEEIRFENGLHQIWFSGSGIVNITSISGQCAILGGNPLTDTTALMFPIGIGFLLSNQCIATISATNSGDQAGSLAIRLAGPDNVTEFVQIGASISADSSTGSELIPTVTATLENSDDDSEFGFSRANPVPLGEWFTFATGELRIVSVEERPVPQYNGTVLQQGERLYYISMEYHCVVTGIDELCKGTDVVSNNAYITEGGNIITPASIYNDVINVMGNEAYNGAILTGGVWFVVLGDSPLNLYRVNLRLTEGTNGVPVFFALS